MGWELDGSVAYDNELRRAERESLRLYGDDPYVTRMCGACEYFVDLDVSEVFDVSSGECENDLGVCVRYQKVDGCCRLVRSSTQHGERSCWAEA